MKRLNLILAVIALGATAVAINRWQLSAELRDTGRQASVPMDSPTDATPAPGILAEMDALREQSSDLPRLRNEVGRLRAATNQLVTLRQENARLEEAKRTGAPLPPPVPPGFVSKDQLLNAGLLTPDAAVQTFFWAVRETNFHLAIETWSRRMREKEFGADENRKAKLEEEFSGNAGSMMRRFNNFGVLQREQISPEEQVLEISSSFGQRGTKVRLIIEDGVWKIDKFE